MTRIKYVSMVFIFCSLFSFAAHKGEIKTNSEIKNSSEDRNTGPYAGMPDAPADKWFETVLALNKARVGNSGQIVLATNTYLAETGVTIRTFEKKNGQWVEKFAKTMGLTGRNGFARYKEKKEGDGKAPTGVFFLGPVYGEKGLKVSTKMEYWAASDNDYWIDDIKSAQYNRWVTSSIDPNTDSVSRERMKRTEDYKYKYGIAVQYNMDQVKGKGSVITLHVVYNNKTTAGCIAIPEMKLLEIIGWLDPAQKPLVIMGTQDELDTKPVSGPALDKNDKYIWKKEQYKPAAK